MTQKTAILQALQSGEVLTGLKALEKFQCMTLAQRISELRREGYPIIEERVPNVPGGRKRISSYRIERTQP